MAKPAEISEAVAAPGEVAEQPERRLMDRPREEAPELPAFYSRLERTVESKMPERAPARQILGIIQGAGLKGEELKRSGIGPALDRLAAEHQGKIPKAAVLDYLRTDGAVRLEEVALDSRIEPSPDLAESLDKHTTRLPSTCRVDRAGRRPRSDWASVAEKRQPGRSRTFLRFIR